MRKVLVILGPTATGKTGLALNLARQFDGELVACDSRQVYKDLDIGTGKLPSSKLRVEEHDNKWEIDRINVWMYDVVKPDVLYSVYNYVKDAVWVIEDILIRDKLPIIVGGTGLYLKALFDGLPNLSIPVDEKLRRELRKLSVAKLQSRLRRLSPATWKTLNQSDRKNPRRLLRSIEIHNMYGYRTRDTVCDLGFKNYDVLRIGLTAPRSVLYQKIDSRVLVWIKAGIVKEVKDLVNRGISLEKFKGFGLNYYVVARYVAGRISEDQLITQLQIKTRQYAKRQMTWFRKYENYAQWFDITDPNWAKKIEKLVQNWYDPS